MMKESDSLSSQPPVQVAAAVATRRATRRYDEAVTQWRDILELDPNSADARLYLGLTYLEKGMFREAQLEFERWGELRQEAPTALLAYTHAAAGDRAQAQRLLDVLLSEERQRPPAAAIALIYGQLGEPDNAFRWRTELWSSARPSCSSSRFRRA